MKHLSPITKYPSPNIVRLVIGHCLVLGAWCLVFGVSPAMSQDNGKLVSLSKQIIETKDNEDLYAPFAELKDAYFKDNKYSEFTEFLESLGQKKKELEPFVDYYVALTRFHQLKYLEETQKWEEYFNQGNSYKEQLAASLQKAVDATGAESKLHIYARLLLWQFHKDQEGVSAEEETSSLVDSVLVYAKDARDITPIKEAADKLFALGQKAESKELYRVYVDKIAASDITDNQLSGIAFDFYKAGSFELAELIYDVYIPRILKASGKEGVAPILADIAKRFVYPAGPVYAEKIFKQIEFFCGPDAFDEELIYLRAFNLEKFKEYPQAKDVYLSLLGRFPQSRYADQAYFKAGIIATYVLRDIKSGRDYFGKLADMQASSPQGVSAVYQLGLLSQWEGDLENAKKFYLKSTEKSGGVFQETESLASERLKEIEEAKPIEYSLKLFLDASLKEENAAFNMSKLSLEASAGRINKDENIKISSTPYLPETGCMQVGLQYFWSGHLGKNRPLTDQAAFDTAYTDSGTKEINLIVVSPAGIIDRSIEIVDVY